MLLFTFLLFYLFTFLPLYDGKTLGDADEEPMSVDVLLEVVDLVLLHVTQIAYTQGELSADGSVDG